MHHVEIHSEEPVAGNLHGGFCGGRKRVICAPTRHFLSYQVYAAKKPLHPIDFIVLNSLSFFEKARCVMENYRQVKLYLDNDNAGQICTLYAVSLSTKYKDESGLYKNYKDMNDWLVNKDLKKQKRIGRKI